MKDQIKIQVSDDGLFGTPRNPYDENVDFYAEINCIINPEWIDFAKDHPQLPLTTPQIPKSVVMGEMVEQYWHKDYKEWFSFPDNFPPKGLDQLKIDSPDEVRQAYSITPVPNSEPMEAVEDNEDISHLAGLPLSEIYLHGVIAGCRKKIKQLESELAKLNN